MAVVDRVSHRDDFSRGCDSEWRADGLHHLGVDLLDAAAGVDDDDTVGGDLGDLLVGLGDGALQVEALGLEAVLAVRAAEADLGVDAQQDREVGPEAVGGGVGEGDDLAGAEAAGRSLVGDAGVGEAVGDDVAAGLQGGADDLGGEVGAGRGEEQQLGEGVEGEVGVGEQLADPLGGVGPPRLADQQGLGAERLGQQARLGALA